MNNDEDLYQRVARLAYLTRFEVGDSRARAHQIAAAVVRKAAKGTPDSAMDRALVQIIKAGTRPSRRGRRGFWPEAVDAQGHVCGTPVTAGTTSAKYCV